MASLSWVKRSAAPPGASATPAASSFGQVLPRHVLVIERDHVAAGREREQLVQVLIVAQPHVRADLGGAVRGRIGQHPEPDPERDGRLVRHPGQLPGADHAHDGERGPGVLIIGHPP